MVRHFLVSNGERERVVIAPSERAAAERFARFTGEDAEVVQYGVAVPTLVRGRCSACGRPIMDSDVTWMTLAGWTHVECPMGRD